VSKPVPFPIRLAAPRATAVLAYILALGVFVEAAFTGHEGGALLAVHIPAAVAATGLVVRQVTLSNGARGVGGQ